MKHRATIERNSGAAETDAWGDQGEPEWQTHLIDVPCRAWFGTEREVTDGNKTAAVEERRAIMPLGTDVTEADRILSVKDRKGTVLFDGPIRIESVGHRQDHLALVLEAV